MNDEKITPLSEKIKAIIENKLSFTNGWYIEEEKYSKLCYELSKEIIELINKNNKQALKNFCEEIEDIVDRCDKSRGFDMYTFEEELKEAKLKHFGEDLV